MEVDTIISNARPQDPAANTGDWTPETIQRFWEYYGKRADLHADYFSCQVGSGIATLLADTNRLKPGISFLDYGCGPGFLVEKMLARRARCYGIDGSSKAVELVNQKFKNDVNWMGAVAVSDSTAPFPETSFDLITCLETLEHVLDKSLPFVVADVYRLLKPGGVALFTTPNNEDLLHGQTYCPFCETSFHKVQHVRSFSVDSLRDLVESQRFKTLFCRGIDLHGFQQPWSLPGWRDLSIRDMTGWLRRRKNRLLDRVAPRPFPNGRDFSDRATATQGPHLCALVERSKL